MNSSIRASARSARSRWCSACSAGSSSSSARSASRWSTCCSGSCSTCSRIRRLIAWLRGNGVLLSTQQLPDLRDRFDACCARLGLDRDKPEAYLLPGNGTLNAFATRFLGRELHRHPSDTVDAMQAHPDGVNFYFGHELGHVRMKHITGNLLRAPGALAADPRRGLLAAPRNRPATGTAAPAARRRRTRTAALVALAAGAQRWRMVDLAAFEAQASLSSGFWMSYHDPVGGL